MTKAPAILNINDSEASRFALSKMLRHAGYEVVEAETGLAGVEIARTLLPSVILLDIKLPDIDGFEVCRRLKSDPLTANIPVLHVTAHATTIDNRVQSLEQGAEAYITFPIDRTYLVATVKSLARLAQAERDRAMYVQGLADKNQELSVALAELEAERIMKEHFVAALSHDLRNPLAAIRLSAQTGKKMMDKPASIEKFLNRIENATNRIDQMIQDLLDVSQLRSGQALPLKRAPADLRTIVNEVAEDVRLKFQADIQVEGASTCPAETIDPQAFRRVCENLVQNAAKYGDLSLPITLSLNVEANQAILKVKNFGNPISDEKLHHLFEPFTRGDQAVSTNQPGWGLGLTVVRGLVDAHNGSVQVTSSQEAGTSFVLRFPLV